TEDLHFELSMHGIRALPPGVMVYEIAGPMFFGAVENFERTLLEIHADVKILIIRLRRVPFMDITGIQTLEEVVGKLRKRGVKVVLCEANQRVTAKLRRAGVLEDPRPDEYAQRLIDAIRSA